MKLSLGALFLLFAAAMAIAEEKPIDTSIVFRNSQAYLSIKKRNPGLRLLLLEEAKSPRWVQVAIVEDHPTHVVILERLRVHSDGSIERLTYDAEGDDVWLPDSRSKKKLSEQAGADQPAAGPESKSEGKQEPQPESKPAPR